MTTLRRSPPRFCPGRQCSITLILLYLIRISFSLLLSFFFLVWSLLQCQGIQNVDTLQLYNAPPWCLWSSLTFVVSLHWRFLAIPRYRLRSLCLNGIYTWYMFMRTGFNYAVSACYVGQCCIGPLVCKLKKDIEPWRAISASLQCSRLIFEPITQRTLRMDNTRSRSIEMCRLEGRLPKTHLKFVD